MPNGGIGAFAEGFTKAFSAGQEQRRLRDALALDQERFERQEQRAERSFGLDVLQFENTLQQQERDAAVEQERLGLERGRFGLEQQRFGIEEQRFGLDEQRFEREGEEQQFQREMDQERLNIEQEELRLQSEAARAKEQFDLRSQDREALKMLEGLNKIPKAARKLYMRNIAKQLQMDPNSEDFKELTNAISGMDPEELKQTTGIITGLFPQLPPGQGAALASGFVRGDITLPQVIDTAEKLRVQAARQSRRSSIPQFDPEAAVQGRLTSQQPIAQQPMQQPGAEAGAEVPTVRTAEDARAMQQRLLAEADQAAQAGDNEDADNLRAQAGQFGQMAGSLEEFDPGAVEKREAAKITGERRAQRKQPLNNRVANILGLQGAGKLTIGEFEELGGFADIAGSTDLPELSEKKAGAQRLMEKATDLSRMVEGKEELVGIAGSALRGVDTLISQVKGLGNLGKRLLGSENAFSNSSVVQDWAVNTGIAGLSAQIRSRVIGLAFEMATAREDGRLSDQDFERARQELGDAGSIDQMQAVLGDLVERTRSRTISEIEAATGMAPLDLMSPEQLGMRAEEAAGAGQERILKAIIREQNRRLSRRKANGQ